jgi:hypothetical protein
VIKISFSNPSPQIRGCQLQATSGFTEKFVWGSMVEFQKPAVTFKLTVDLGKTAAAHHTVLK